MTLSAEQAARQLATVLRGDLLDVRVVALTPSGRAATVRVTGTLGSVDVFGLTARTLLGLRSSWFTVRRSAAQPAPVGRRMRQAAGA